MESKTFFIVLPLVYSLASHAVALDHAIVQKSPNELQLECSQYLPASDGSQNVDCSDRCLGLVGRFWNDSIGRPAQSIARYYQTDSCNLDYITLTDQCLCENVLTLPRKAYCQRASAGVQCYLDNYGQLLAGTPQFVPVTDARATQIFLTCSQMLQISSDRLGQIFKEGYNKTSEGRCLTRCFLVRAGLYNDYLGPNIGRFAVQCQGYNDQYVQSVNDCYARLKNEQLDSCSLATRVMDECIIGNPYSVSSLLDLMEVVGTTVVLVATTVMTAGATLIGLILG